jgi:hypothetical protein
MNEETGRRLQQMVDQEADSRDPMYHATVRLFRQWVVVAEQAMKDEGVSNSVIQAVLNRLILGHPAPGHSADEMVVKRSDLEELVMHQDPRRHLQGFPSMLGTMRPSRNAPGQRDVSDTPLPPPS